MNLEDDDDADEEKRVGVDWRKAAGGSSDGDGIARVDLKICGWLRNVS